MLLTKTCYYLENQVFGSVNNQDMSLIETCFYSRFYGNQNLAKNLHFLTNEIYYISLNHSTIDDFTASKYCLGVNSNTFRNLKYPSMDKYWFEKNICFITKT